MSDVGHRWVVHQSHDAQRFASWLRERSSGRELAHPVEVSETDLGRIAEDGDVEGLVVASLAPVARNLLRELPCPVVVVPTDVDPTSLGSGPVLVGIELDDASVAAADFGRELGRRLELPTMLVHTVTGPRPSPTAALREWVERNGFDDLSLELRVGRRRATLLAAARQHAASLVVCGSRRLSPIQRLFQSSTSTELAAHATRPVAVVPAAA